jgi:hypothetical protein
VTRQIEQGLYQANKAGACGIYEGWEEMSDSRKSLMLTYEYILCRLPGKSTDKGLYHCAEGGSRPANPKRAEI